jgi:ABC-type glycerol-3-phosphate transport system permease component
MSVAEPIVEPTGPAAPQLVRVARQAERMDWRRRHNAPQRWMLVVALALLALSALFPLYFMFSASFRTQLDWDNAKVGLPTTLSLRAFRDAWTGANIGEYLRNSTVITLITVAMSVALASTAGYAFSRMRWRFRGIAYYFVLAWLAIPPVVLIVPIYVEMVNLNLINTYWSVILLYTALNMPFNVYLMTAFFHSLPAELIEAARMDGATPHQIFARIMLPMAKPALATLCVFNVLYVWNEFIFALLLLQSDSVKTLTVGVLQLQGRFTTNDPALMAGLLLASLPVIAAYLFFQKYLVRAIVAGAVK